MKYRPILTIPLGVFMGFTALIPPIRAQQKSYSFEGEGGFKKSFTLGGGEYELYLVAKHPYRGYDLPGSEYCGFAAALERSSPTYERISLGSGVEVSRDNILPWKIDRILTLPAGEYALWVANESDCKWSFDLVLTGSENKEPAPQAQSKPVVCCISALGILKSTKGSVVEVSTVSPSDLFIVYALYKKADPGPPIGVYQITQGDSIVDSGALLTSTMTTAHYPMLFFAVKPNQLKRVVPGKMTVAFITSVGKETAEFTVTR